MTKEDKDLLFKDLCARLPYHVRVKIWLKDGTTEEGALDLEHNYADVLKDAFYYNKIIDIKPYLRPMSTMTKKEEKEYSKYAHFGNTLGDWTKSIDYLKSHHLDYRGLIPMDLALPAPEGMYDF